MPLFCSGVKQGSFKKPVPITRKNGGYIVPEERGIVLDGFKAGAHKHLLWELESETPNIRRRLFILRIATPY